METGTFEGDVLTSLDEAALRFLCFNSGTDFIIMFRLPAGAEELLYHPANKAETVFRPIKHTFKAPEIKSPALLQLFCSLLVTL